MRQAFTMTRRNDKKILPIVIGAFVGVAAVIYLLGVLITGHDFLPIPISILFGLLGRSSCSAAAPRPRPTRRPTANRVRRSTC